MKSFVLSISLPVRRTLSQDICLDELISDKRLISYRRYLRPGTAGVDPGVQYDLTFRLPD